MRRLAAVAVALMLFGLPPSVDAAPAQPQCDDGIDNDGDGHTDYLDDPGCTDILDNDETDPVPPECSDGIDNDYDGLVDHPDDPECGTPEHPDESCPPRAICEHTECFDDYDNDGDGLIDYPDDPGCSAPDDFSEYGGCEDLVGDVSTRSVCRDTASELSIRYRARIEVFAGALASSRRICQRERRVLLKKIRPGRDPILGEDLTGTYGNWDIPWDARSGRYYARVHGRTVIDNSGNPITCLGNRSSTVMVER